MTITIGQLIRECSALRLDELSGAVANIPFRGASIDTRTIKPGEMFFALPGDRVDGHEYIRDALARGAALVIGAASYRGARDHHASILWVDDVLVALTEMARTWRSMLTKTRVIAVTGSNGKTTVCRLLHGALSSERRAIRSRRSFNNQLGVPLTVLSAAPEDEFIVCEIGANAPGEIATLGAIAQPDMAVVTSIGRAHVGGFGSADAVLKEKASLAHTLSSDGVAFVAEEPADLQAIAAHGGRHVRTVGFGDESSARLSSADHRFDRGEPRLHVTMDDGACFESTVIGRHNASNIGFAVAVARHCGVQDDSIQRGLLVAELPSMRQEICTIDDVMFFNDAYNANPESMAASVATFLELTPRARRRAIVLGDMLELGNESHSAHVDLLQLIATHSDVARVILFGSAFAAAASEMSDHPFEVHNETSEESFGQLARQWEAGDAVLVKGSRGLQLERVVRAYEQRGIVPA